ncbi:PAS domain-containing sensor histidine kinase [Stappia sp. ES.058]|uniref:PAS domain-containing sensor histidine kinase n=1 Tax=Stappia sp. ES.058 TaxID=1881061 RepID=UPI00087D57FD|nr:PAS domain-containing sensor histidine kinase [Stappia sp. ES.058]SDU47548.1 Signal transduction histidine kinase [Stappia sp. ES.058]
MPADGLQHARTSGAWLELSRKTAVRATGGTIAWLSLAGTSRAQDASALPLGDIDAFKVVWVAAIGGAVTFAVTAAVTFLRNRRATAGTLSRVREKNAGLTARLDRLESLVDSDDQRLIVWQPGDAAPMIAGVLDEACGVPRSPARLLAFGTWLDAKSATALERAVERLRRNGETFHMVLPTQVGGLVEISGRVAASAPVVRMRDLTGERKNHALLAKRHEELTQEAATLRALLDTVPAPAWLRNGDGRLVWANAAYARAVEALDGTGAVDAGAEFLDAHNRKAMDRARDESGVAHARMPAVSAGARRIFDVTQCAIESGTGGLAIDVSELEHSRQELGRTIDFHARTLDQLATAVAIFGSDRRLQFYNAAFRSLWDLDTGFLEGNPTDGALLDALRAARKLPEQADYRGWRNKLLESYTSVDAREFWWHLPDGRTLRVIANPHPQGGVTYIYENVTERLDLESRYNSLIRVQGETLDNLSEAVAVFGSDGRLRLWNPAFEVIWDLSDDGLGDSPHITRIVEAGLLEPEEAHVWQRLVTAVTSLADNREPVIGRMERESGEAIDYATVPLPDGGTLVTFVNVTDSVNIERALLDKNEALEQADQLKNAFIQHVSYELRSPLTNIIGFAQLLSDPKFGPLTTKQSEYVDYILSSSSALLAIINDILDLATIDAGIMELDLSSVDVARTVQAAVEGLKDRLTDSGIALNLDMSDDVGVIQADERRLRQVLYNLISNALRFSDVGGAIDVSCQRTADAIEFRVRDHGCGIPEDMLDQVFARFVGRDAGARRRGAGLGLSIVKSFVELHGGTVEITSQEGVGTYVVCRFPFAPDALQHAAE